MKKITYKSRDGLICYKDQKSGNILSVYDIKATKSLDEACDIINVLLERLAIYEGEKVIDDKEELNTPKEPCHPPASLIWFCPNPKCPEDKHYLMMDKFPHCPVCNQKLDWTKYQK